MITVRITATLNKHINVNIYTFVCPACGKFIIQLCSEPTPLNCKWCARPLSDVKGIIEKETCRIFWHGMKSPSWEKY